jgi:UDPglucose 6-dehydrogenase
MDNKRRGGLGMKIGVVGIGFVGKAVARGLALNAEVKTWDIDDRKTSHPLEEVVSSDYCFVCLPTPMDDAEGGRCDLSIIDGFFKKVSEMGVGQTVFIIKSTVPIGTTQRISSEFGVMVLHNPEFLTARCSLLDYVTPARTIIGYPEDMKYTAKHLSMFMEDRFPGVPCHVMTSNESEAVKYMANAFFATKVSFFNEMALLADKMGMNWDSVLEGVISDGRIAKSHTDVPGHDGKLGYGGTCFPKDINALMRTFEDNGLDPKILKASWEQNKVVRERKDWDWEHNPSAVSDGACNPSQS